MAGRTGTRDPNARREGLNIRVSEAEKLMLENVAQLIAADRGYPGASVSYVLRELLLEATLEFSRRKLAEQNPGKSEDEPRFASFDFSPVKKSK